MLDEERAFRCVVLALCAWFRFQKTSHPKLQTLNLTPQSLMLVPACNLGLGCRIQGLGVWWVLERG